MRHKRAFEQCYENGRLAFESCHRRGAAGPGCPNNRRRFEQAFERAWRDSNRSGKPLSLLVVDADHFKRVNDRYGHAAGDEVLKGLARCLLAIAHRPGDFACRIGGEEFVILLPDTDAAEALRIARRVHEAVRTLALPSALIGVGCGHGEHRPRDRVWFVGRAGGSAVQGGGRGPLRGEGRGAQPDSVRRGRCRPRRGQAPTALGEGLTNRVQESSS
ncbi:hypothetical protein CLBKND_04827 [Methylorubrum aminovorans]